MGTSTVMRSIRRVLGVSGAVVLAAALLGCLPSGLLPGPLAELRTELEKDPVVLTVDGRGANHPDVSNSSALDLELIDATTLSDLQRVSETIRAAIEPLGGPDPRVTIRIGARDPEWAVLVDPRVRFDFEEFALDAATLEAELDYWWMLREQRTVDYFKIGHPYAGGDYERTIAISVPPGTAVPTGWVGVGEVPDPTGAPTGWSVGTSVDWRESHAAALGVEYGPSLSSAPALPPDDVLGVWELAVSSNPDGAIESEWVQTGTRSYLSLIVSAETGSPEGDWDRLLTVARAALAVTSADPVVLRFVGSTGDASVSFHTDCPGGAPPKSDRDRTEQFLADLGPDAPEDPFIGSCGE